MEDPFDNRPVNDFVDVRKIFAETKETPHSNP